MSEEGIPATRYPLVSVIDGVLVKVGYCEMSGGIVVGTYVTDDRVLKDKSIEIRGLITEYEIIPE